MLMPHESTVAHDKTGLSLFGASLPVHTTTPTAISASPTIAAVQVPVITAAAPAKTTRMQKRADSQVPNLFANPP